MGYNKNKAAQKKRRQSTQIRYKSTKRRQNSSIVSAINTTAPLATPLSIPSSLTSSTVLPEHRHSITSRTRIQPRENTIPPPVIQGDDNSPIVVNDVEIPSLCADINRKNTLDKALEFLTRTKIEEDPL